MAAATAGSHGDDSAGKKVSNFLALDFQSSKPKMFGPALDACLHALHTHKDHTGIQLHSPSRKLSAVQVLPADSLLCMPLLYTPSPIAQSKNVLWTMDG